jgi:hypothetical protein
MRGQLQLLYSWFVHLIDSWVDPSAVLYILEEIG